MSFERRLLALFALYFESFIPIVLLYQSDLAKKIDDPLRFHLMLAEMREAGWIEYSNDVYIRGFCEIGYRITLKGLHELIGTAEKETSLSA